MKKIMAFVLSIMMILTVAPGLAMAAQTKDAEMDAVLNVEGGALTFEDTNGWAVAADGGRDVAQSQNHDGGSEGVLVLNATVEAGDILTFDYKVSSEEGYDGLVFVVGNQNAGVYTGEVDWTQGWYVFETAGNVQIMWGYVKDGSVSVGDDCAWLDNIYLGENTTELEALDVPAEITASLGETSAIEVAPVPAYAPLGNVTFESADESVATVDEDGVITPVSIGETEITVASGDITARVNVTVVEGINAQAFLVYSKNGEANGLYDVELITNTIEMQLEMDSIFAAELVGDYIYAYTDASVFYVIDAETYEIIDEVQASNGVQDMTFNYSDMTMYGITANPAIEEGASDLVTIDLTTGETTVVETLDFYALTLAARDGKLYAISYDTGILYNITDGVEVMNTGVKTAYIQTMSFDHATGDLYWLGCMAGSTFAAMIDVQGAEMTILNDHEVMYEYAGLMFPTPEVEMETVPVTGITLDKTQADMIVMDELQITATIAPEDATNNRIAWTTSDPLVATVSSTGLVKATGAGDAIITATTRDGGFTATCRVTVKGTFTYILYEDFEDELEGWTFVDADGDGYEWEQQIDAVAEYGAPHEGTGFINSESYVNNVGPLTPDNWLISPAFEVLDASILSFYVQGQDPTWCEEPYGVYVLPEGYADLDDGVEIYYGVSTADWENIIVELDEYAGQKVHVAFRHYDITDMFSLNLDLVTVSSVDTSDPIHVTGVTLDKTEADMVVFEELQLTATLTPADATIQRVLWTSSDETVAKVDANGVVTALKAGNAVITVTTVDGLLTATCNITVEGEAHTLLYEDFEDALEGWSSVDADADGNNWTHDMNNQHGWAHEGTGYIYSESYSRTTGTPLTPDNWLISPSFAAGEYTKIAFHVASMDPEYLEPYGVYVIPEGFTDLTAAVKIHEGIAPGVWEEVALTLGGYAGQKIHIAFRHSDVEDMFVLKLDTVSVQTAVLPDPIPVTGVTLDKTEAELEIGATVQLTATVAPADATNKALVWSTSDAAIATVSDTGLVTAVAAGTATITVKTVDGEFTATCTITVKEAAPTYTVGDANGDGVVNTGDAVVILQYVAELVELTPDQLLAGDANRDGVVNTGDAVSILQYVAELITEL